MEYVLTTDHLCKNYGHFKALNQCSMQNFSNAPRMNVVGCDTARFLPFIFAKH